MQYTYDMFVAFENWRKEAPHRRAYNVDVCTNGNVHVYVYDHVWKVGQFVESPKEINLLAAHRQKVHRKTLEWMRNPRKRPAAADLPE